MKLRKLNFEKNKKGQFESVLLAVISIFVVGIILFFMNHLSNEFYTSFDDYFNSSVDYNESEAHDAVLRIQEVDNSVWDYAFLAIFIGLILNLVIFSYATRISIAFYWIFAVLGIVIFIVGLMMSNIWQDMADEPTFSETILRFPITNALLGSYMPTMVIVVLMIFMIVLFGKPPGQQP